uniref:Uncharacterized protein n=1 Tax=Chenopodium quinoa TaxID=63459 RepID=A0A803MLZ3_CHEQI
MSQEHNHVVGEGPLETLVRITFAFVELGIVDIIHSHGNPIRVSEICVHFKSHPPNFRCLKRVMQILVRRDIFTTVNVNPTKFSEDDTLYWLTPASRLLLRHDDDDISYAPMILMQNHPQLLAAMHHLSSAIKEAKIGFRAIMSPYKNVFADVKSVVDVGGGTGAAVNEVVKAFPNIKGINFDLPHVIAIAPKYDGVAHVEGDMFEAIPDADVAILKSILHDWNDEDCVKILKNCRKDRKADIV